MTLNLVYYVNLMIKIKVKVCSVILIRFCMIYAYSRPRYQVIIYRTIGPLVFYSEEKINLLALAKILLTYPSVTV